MSLKHIVRGAVIGFVSMVISSNAYPFNYEGKDIEVSANMSETYDDNINSSEDKEEDYKTDFMFSIGTRYEGKLSSLQFDGQIRHEMFSKHDEANNTSGGFTLNLQKGITQYDIISLSNTFSRTFDPGAGGFESEFGRSEGRSKTTQNTMSIGYSRDISEQVSANISYTNGMNRTSGETITESNQDSYAIQMNYAYSVATGLFASYNYSKQTFEGSESYPSESVSAGFKQVITNQISINGSIGVDFVEFSNGKNTGESIGISLTDEVDEKNVVVIGFTKNKQIASDKEDLFDSWRVTGSLKRQLSDKVGSSFSGFYGQGENIQSEVRDELLGASLSIGYEIYKNLNGNLSYSYSDRKLSNPYVTGGYDRNLISIGLAMVF